MSGEFADYLIKEGAMTGGEAIKVKKSEYNDILNEGNFITGGTVAVILLIVGALVFLFLFKRG